VTKFSINLNKFALLRNSRGRDLPNLVSIAKRCVARGVHGLTLHPRPDQRHARYSDVADFAALLRSTPNVELNIEGNPVPRFIEVVLANKPHQVTLVPDADDQLTSDHGWDAIGQAAQLTALVRTFADAGIRTSVFMDPVVEQIEAVAKTGADRIELYTEAYADAFGTPEMGATLETYATAARAAQALGMGVNAGHDLNQANLAQFLRAVPNVLEVSIGHAVVCESFDTGLEATLDAYLAIVAAANH
jgi:pyridoxine 5-phosphate synthase